MNRSRRLGESGVVRGRGDAQASDVLEAFDGDGRGIGRGDPAGDLVRFVDVLDLDVVESFHGGHKGHIRLALARADIIFFELPDNRA